MTIDNIISRVRLAIDEETVNNADFGSASAGDSSKMDNIIKASIGTALQWVCIHAPSELLVGKDGTVSPATDSTFVDDVELTAPGGTGDKHFSNITFGSPSSTIGCSFGVEGDFLRLIRVRGDNWHRAVMSPLSEDSDEYLQLRDVNGAKATEDRPQAALVLSETKKIEAYPAPTTSITYTYVKDPLSAGTDYTDVATTSTTGPSVPTKAQGALIYYIAFLVLSAYGDSRSARMLEIAQMNLGK